MNTDNWKTAINGRDNKRRSKGQKSNTTLESANGSDNIGCESTEPTQQNQTSSPLSDQKVVVKSSWADMSEPADVLVMLSAFNQEMSKKCTSLADQLTFVTSGVVSLLNLGLQTIQQERTRVGKSENEKNIVRDLHEICTAGRGLVTAASTAVKTVTTTIDLYEAEKNRALNELKSFLATLDAERIEKEESLSSQKKALVGRYAAVVSQDGLRNIAASQNIVQRPIDTVSIQLGDGYLTVPLARNIGDIQPMSIKFTQDLGVFLINLDGKLYSFCDGSFTQRAPKSGDSTLFGKRCNPNIAHCAGATCTYYHDPLVHTNGHTVRNMGVHYVVSELIGGVSTTKEIAETARSRNPYIVEDLVQLAGMLMIKAFMVKKMKESLRNH